MWCLSALRAAKLRAGTLGLFSPTALHTTAALRGAAAGDAATAVAEAAAVGA